MSRFLRIPFANLRELLGLLFSIAETALDGGRGHRSIGERGHIFVVEAQFTLRLINGGKEPDNKIVIEGLLVEHNAFSLIRIRSRKSHLL